MASDESTGHDDTNCGDEPDTTTDCPEITCSGVDFDLTDDGILNVLDVIVLIEEVFEYQG